MNFQSWVKAKDQSFHLSLFVLFIGLVSLDQLSKGWALKALSASKSVKVPSLGFHLTMNDGIAFGIELPQWGIWALSFCVLGLAIPLTVENKRWRSRPHLMGITFLLAGAAGNMIDRARLGEVVDFIKVYWWPTFNLADAWILIGVGLLAWGVLAEIPLKKTP